jgi:predicted transcriptional regulator
MTRNNHMPGSTDSTGHPIISTDCSSLLDTLGNPSARAILREATDKPVTIDELCTRCGVSRTTIYRRVNELHDLGLLEESVRFTKANQQHRQFETTSSEVRLRISSNGFEADLRSNGAGAPSNGLLLDESSLEQFRIALSGKDLQFRIETDGQTAEEESVD